jgi:hypothetical protein
MKIKFKVEYILRIMLPTLYFMLISHIVTIVTWLLIKVIVVVVVAAAVHEFFGQPSYNIGLNYIWDNFNKVVNYFPALSRRLKDQFIQHWHT